MYWNWVLTSRLPSVSKSVHIVSQLSTHHSGIIIVEVMLTHSSPCLSYTHFHSPLVGSSTTHQSHCVLSCTVKIYVLHTYTETELTWFTIMIYKQIVVCRLLSLEVKWSGRCWILLQNLLHCSLVSWKIHYCVNFCYLFSCLTWWLTLITDNKVWMFMVQVLQLHMVAALMERYGWWVVLLPTRGEWKCV